MPKSKLDPWHFARPELAQRYLQTFQIGLISAQALFAPRRMGKSEFLEQDLIPAAQKSGLLTAYLNLWDAREHPRGALISALARAGSPRPFCADQEIEGSAEEGESFREGLGNRRRLPLS